MRKPLAVAAATLAVVLGLAACGGSDESDDTLSNSELIAQADEICTKYENELTTLLEETNLNDNSSRQEITAFISDELVPVYQAEVEELKALEPNEDDAEAFNDIVDTFDSQVQAVADDPEAAVDQEDPFAEATAKAQEFGLEACGAQ